MANDHEAQRGFSGADYGGGDYTSYQIGKMWGDMARGPAYAPPDPVAAIGTRRFSRRRPRWYKILLGIALVATVFALVWTIRREPRPAPAKARQSPQQHQPAKQKPESEKA